jgi:hypothetical protein
MEELPGNASVLPALHLMFSASSGLVQSIHHMDHRRELRCLGRKKNLYDVNQLMEFDCKEVKFLYPTYDLSGL